jgi:hypothetical protein
VDRISAWAERRAAPVVAAIAIVVLFIAYSLLGHNIVGGGRFKLYAPSDLWSLAGSSWALAHGHFTVTVLSVTAVAYCLRILLETELNWYYL